MATSAIEVRNTEQLIKGKSALARFFQALHEAFEQPVTKVTDFPHLQALPGQRIDSQSNNNSEKKYVEPDSITLRDYYYLTGGNPDKDYSK